MAYISLGDTIKLWGMSGSGLMIDTHACAESSERKFRTSVGSDCFDFNVRLVLKTYDEAFDMTQGVRLSGEGYDGANLGRVCYHNESVLVAFDGWLESPS